MRRKIFPWNLATSRGTELPENQNTGEISSVGLVEPTWFRRYSTLLLTAIEQAPKQQQTASIFLRHREKWENFWEVFNSCYYFFHLLHKKHWIFKPFKYLVDKGHIVENSIHFRFELLVKWDCTFSKCHQVQWRMQ